MSNEFLFTENPNLFQNTYRLEKSGEISQAPRKKGHQRSILQRFWRSISLLFSSKPKTTENIGRINARVQEILKEYLVTMNPNSAEDRKKLANLKANAEKFNLKGQKHNSRILIKALSKFKPTLKSPLLNADIQRCEAKIAEISRSESEKTIQPNTNGTTTPETTQPSNTTTTPNSDEPTPPQPDTQTATPPSPPKIGFKEWKAKDTARVQQEKADRKSAKAQKKSKPNSRTHSSSSPTNSQPPATPPVKTARPPAQPPATPPPAKATKPSATPPVKIARPAQPPATPPSQQGRRPLPAPTSSTPQNTLSQRGAY